MASQVTTRQFSHLNPPIDSLHKMHQKQHENLLKRMYMPFVRGPKDRHYFSSFHSKYSNAFLKSNPFIPPEDKSYPLAPHRDDLPVINLCSGFMSPGARSEADQQIMYNKTIDPLGNGRDRQPPQWAPIPHRTAQIADKRLSLLLKEVNQDQRWSSRLVPDVSVRSKIGGWTSPVKVIPAPPQTKEYFSPHTFAFHVDPDTESSEPSSEACRDEKAQKYMYTSTTQSTYEEVPWDRILPPKVKPPDSAAELMADNISHCFTMKQYEPPAEIGQVVGGLWDRFQRRSFTTPHRPINFVSPSSRTQHLPLYTGCVGAENTDDLDNPNVDVITHSNVRIAKPRYVKSSYSPNTFGYTGKVHWSATQPVNSNLPPTSPSIISRMYRYMAKHGQPSEFPHLGPLSQILTPTEPQNSFNKKEKERVTI
ncbi:protein SPMIP7 [Rhineura floridana]|uniref:protein SPMIP7 n=1 Tax=Rhineura floridana TaxID=261503 RepID=UPI002AC83A1C|nr:protein SPMIP7 [Rhineura floridana]